MECERETSSVHSGWCEMIAGVSTGALVVFGLIAVALVLFVSEAIPTDVTAIGIIVALAVLEPVTGVGYRSAISGFASTATITIVAMYMLSAGIQRTGLVQRLGLWLARFTRGSETRALAATIATTGPLAGVINNTPVVAVFIPMISELAEKTGISPSKLLLPLSYAAILGGTLTLIGTSTNLLASEFAVDLLGRDPIGMFEFTLLGLVILSVGLAYLMTVGRWLTPARIPVDADLVEEFDLEDHLTHVRVGSNSAAVGNTVGDLEARTEANVRILQLRRESDLEPAATAQVLEYDDGDGPDTTADTDEHDQQLQRAGDLDAEPAALDTAETLERDQRQDAAESYVAVRTDQRIREDDVLTIHGTLQAVNQFVANQGLHQLVRRPVTDETFDESTSEDLLAKAIVPDKSSFVGETLAETRLRELYGTTVLAIRHDGELLRTELGDHRLEAGDVLLVQTIPSSIRYFTDSSDLVVIEEDAFDWLLEDDVDDLAPLSPKTPIMIAIMAGVVGTAALGGAPIVISALAGVFLMVVTGCLSIGDAYDAVSWNVIFLLAGVIPLGVALEATGGSQLIAAGLVSTASYLPLVLVLLLFSVVTGLLANVITPVATVVLMSPIAINAATSLDASAFSFLLAVMFASATSFMTPVGYQTNLMVYGPGGYEFTDFLRVGGPLQFLLAGVTTAGIVLIWGL
ncbi:SLC13 family permease [Natronorubrum sulfidifaciens]|uniref:Citrate/succinate, 2-oxoglutarate/malate transporter n=1 Tax=Natronorubrum sulfidifaciens JCM 14089 TaxID=1230460 RepID=L9W6J6_9EURY|nr:citrate/succinate, 2-oxoglutarate/malate transporter [Natronorubrum sulfidifaciens JCM 14089]